MGRYNILGETIELSESAERFLEVMFESAYDASYAERKFTEFYSSCGSIDNVLDAYGAKTGELLAPIMKKHFESLLELEIFDVSYDDYCDALECKAANKAYFTILSEYEDIENIQEAEAAMRAQRKASRGRFVGGGFGVGGAMKGMATAGVFNAGTGLAHSVANMVGNARSASRARKAKAALYNSDSSFKTLVDGISDTIKEECNYYMHIITNKLDKNYFATGFDLTRSKALFENSKKVDEDKRKKLLVQALLLNPTDYEIYKHIINLYGDSDNSVQEMAEHCAPYVDIKEFKIELMEPYIKKIDFGNKDSINESIEDISQQCKWLGIPENEYISVLKSIIRKHEEREITVDGFTYKSKKDIENARKERNLFDLVSKNLTGKLTCVPLNI